MTHKYYYEIQSSNGKIWNGIFNSSSDEDALESLGVIEDDTYLLLKNVDNDPYVVYDSENPEKVNNNVKES